MRKSLPMAAVLSVALASACSPEASTLATPEPEVAAARLAPADHGGRPLTATMSGDQEVPLGDPDGTGFATITLNQGLGEVCWEINVSDILLPALAAHIHVAPAGVAGPIVVPLSAPDATGSAVGCATGVSEDLIKAIRQRPEDYYVNVHNADFPPGAVRGQLEK